jgi:hypothetical protein
MKTTIALSGLLISCHLAAADIYEFTYEPAAQPAPAKTAAKPAPKPVSKSTAATAVKSSSTPTPQPAPTGEQVDAVVQTPDCAAGATCNDL